MVEKYQKTEHDPLNHVFLKFYGKVMNYGKIGDLWGNKDCQVELPFEKGDKLKEKVVHENVICDGCKCCIVGRRYKCLNCNFDFCDNCEKKKIHNDNKHTFLKSPFGKCLCLNFKEKWLKGSEIIYEKKYYVKLNERKMEIIEKERERGESNSGCTLPNFELRNAKIDDLENIIKIENVSFPRPFPRDEMIRYINDSKDDCKMFFKLLLYESKVAGYMIFERNSKETFSRGNTEYVHVKSLAVNPSFRRKGVGKEFLNYAIKMGKDDYCKYVKLKVSVTNLGAQRLYVKKGFIMQKWCSNYYNPMKEIESYYNMKNEKEENFDAIDMRYFYN